MVLAHAFAPYGKSKSMTLIELLKDEAMACDNYAILTEYISQVFGEFVLDFVGMDSGAVGNHAQLFLRDAENGDLLLDPTIGLVARVDFDSLFSGKSIKEEEIKIFRQHKDKPIDDFANKINSALILGKYRPSDMLYYFHSFDDYLSFSKNMTPYWKSLDVDSVVIRYPTPAARTLRKNLESAWKKINSRFLINIYVSVAVKCRV